MTVSYQYEVASSTSGGFTRLLFMWRGSLYKLIYRELLLFLVAFCVLSALYRNAFTLEQKRLFEKVVIYCDTFINLIPLSFVLGFYVAYVAGRWWQQFMAIPWPDKVMHSLALYVGGSDEQGRVLRRTLMRYLNLSLILVLRSISSAVKRRFPTMEHLVEAGKKDGRGSVKERLNKDDYVTYAAFFISPLLDRTPTIFLAWYFKTVSGIRESAGRFIFASITVLLKATLMCLGISGFMTRIELDMFNAVPNLEFNTYWIPCTWFISHLKEARRQNKITDTQGLKLLMEEFNEFRSKCGLLWSYDWISIPLVYTQVVTLATYSFFLAALVGRQYVEEAKKQLQMEIDIYLPVFTILQFFFFMGLLKVAEQLINPFGDDDEDFELNWLIDRHTKVSYLGVDTLMEKAPPLVKDKYFDDVNLTLPYTGAAVAYKKKTYRGSVHNMMVPEDQQSMFLPEIMEEDETESISNQKSTPKNSFPNLFSNSGFSASSGPAGIWRQSGDSIDIERMASTEETTVSIQEVSTAKIKNFVRKAPRLPTPIAKDKVFNIPDLQQWSSNSTLDSYCSTNNAAHNSSYESPPDEVVEEKETNRKKKVKRKSESETSLKSIVCMTNLNARRPSTASGQWKGIRWKPVIDDRAGDVWSDNQSMRKAERRASEDIKEVAETELTCTKCNCELRQNIINTDPLPKKLDQRHKCEAFIKGSKAFNILNTSSLSISMPNLHISEDSSSDEYVQGED